MNLIDSGLLIHPFYDYQWVTDRIAVGSGVYTKAQIEHLRRDGVTHVIDCRESNEWANLYAGSGVKLFRAPTKDDHKRKGGEWFAEPVGYALNVLSRQPNARILVHCVGGLNRGPSMAYAILVAAGMHPRDAWNSIKSARPVATIAYAGDADRWLDSLGIVNV